MGQIHAYRVLEPDTKDVDGTTLTVATHYTRRWSMRDVTRMAVAIDVAADLAATFTLQSSCDPRADTDPDSADWNDETGVTFTAAATAEAYQVVHVSEFNAPWARLKMVVTTGGDVNSVRVATKP